MPSNVTYSRLCLIYPHVIHVETAGAHKTKERVTSILHNSDHGVKSSASGCGVAWLDDYHIRLVCWL